MPLVHNRIKEHFKKEPQAHVNPDEVVGLGAALLGASMDQLDTLRLRDTTSISIGIALPGGRFKPVIKSNTPVPVTKQYKISPPKDVTENYTIDVFQGESAYVRDNEYLGTLIFSDLPVGKADAKMNIEFQVTEECILRVVASNPESGASEEALLMTYDTPPSIKSALADEKASGAAPRA